MPPGASPVKYDLAAAYDLDAALGQLIGKLDTYLKQRDGDRRHLLGPHPCDNWSGRKRTVFDGEFAKEQAQLHALRDLAIRERAAVRDATSHALKKIADSHPHRR